MKKLFFDIETIPAGNESREALEYLYERKIGKKMKDKNCTRDEAVLELGDLEKFIDMTGLDGAFGRIACLAYAVNDDATRVLSNPSGDVAGEKKLLEDFWFIAAQCDLFVGHNIIDFDLRFILQRSIILAVKPTWNRFKDPNVKPWDVHNYLSFARYSNHPIFDTMMEWSNWGNQKSGLEHVALSLGIPTPKEGIDGSEVAKFYAAGKIKDICDYCMRDVETTRAVYKRMVFEI